MAISRVLFCRENGVASEQPLASLAGFEILQEGGNAADAAFATSFALAVTQHPLGGLGGDFFAFYYDSSEEKFHCLNSSGWAPSGIEGLDSIHTFGPYSVVVPGMVAGVFELHSKFGSLETKKLMKRAIYFAETGFPVSNYLARSIENYYNELPEDAREVFGVSGKPLKAGMILKQESLARTLKIIASEGPDSFYRGKIARSVLEELNKSEKIFTQDDIASFRPEWVQPLRGIYRGIKVLEMPANTMGPVTLKILKELEKYSFSFKPNSEERIRTFLEAYRYAYSWKARRLGDPRFLQKSTLGGSTTSFSVFDRCGNFVVAIQSLYHHFGSRVYVKDAGFFLNNRGSAFSLSGPNSIKPRKRPVHTLSTFILDDGEIKYGMGTSGGDFRPQLHTLFITNMVDWKMSLEDSIDHPRFLWDGSSNIISEKGFMLSKLSVTEKPYPSATGVAAGIEIGNGYRKLVCDARGDGLPVGL
jgi:gamma-glutamyltranspeptidase/glutathione hydrolase